MMTLLVRPRPGARRALPATGDGPSSPKAIMCSLMKAAPALVPATCTPSALRARSSRATGVPVAGTSAGAAFISEHMIANGSEGSTPIAGSVRLAPGLGLTNRFIIDQHFRQRDRLGRLLTALAYNPFAVGIGLDEDTAAFIAPDNTVHVEGSGGITVVDAAEVQFSSMDSVQEGRPVCLLGVKLHILTQGATFNLHSRQADAGSLNPAKT